MTIVPGESAADSEAGEAGEDTLSKPGKFRPSDKLLAFLNRL